MVQSSLQDLNLITIYIGISVPANDSMVSESMVSSKKVFLFYNVYDCGSR